MLRQRIKQWGWQKSRREAEMKAAVRLYREHLRQGRRDPPISLRGQPLTAKSLKEFFRKNPQGQRFEDMPTPSTEDFPVPIELICDTSSSTPPPISTATSTNGDGLGSHHKGQQHNNDVNRLLTDEQNVNRNERDLPIGPQNLSEGPCADYEPIKAYCSKMFRQDTNFFPRSSYPRSHPRHLLKAWAEVIASLWAHTTNQPRPRWKRLNELAKSFITIEAPCTVLYLAMLRKLSRTDYVHGEFFAETVCPRWRHFISYCLQQSLRLHGPLHPLSVIVWIIESAPRQEFNLLLSTLMNCVADVSPYCSALNLWMHEDDCIACWVAAHDFEDQSMYSSKQQVLSAYLMRLGFPNLINLPT